MGNSVEGTWVTLFSALTGAPQGDCHALESTVHVRSSCRLRCSGSLADGFLRASVSLVRHRPQDRLQMGPPRRPGARPAVGRPPPPASTRAWPHAAGRRAGDPRGPCRARLGGAQNPCVPARSAADHPDRPHRHRRPAPPRLHRAGRGERLTDLAFERDAANQLWQADFKGPLDFRRCKLHLFDVLDDHSRYALACELLPDRTMAGAWRILWNLFGEVGLPEAVLCDNAFAARTNTGLSWFDAQLIRLGVRPVHGRPYHPQTQGKIERWHGTLQAEAFRRVCWDSPDTFAADLRRWRTEVYNAVRPHEALGDRPPVTRWRLSTRRRPSAVPVVEYPSRATLRKVMQKGEISWHNCEILVGAGIAGDWVRVEERDGLVAVWYSWKEIRRLPIDHLRKRAIV